MLLGMLFTSTVGETVLGTWVMFITLMIIHVVANYYAVQCLKLKTFNGERYRLTVLHWLDTKKIATLEHVLFTHIL
eukprot:UN24064